MTDRAPLTRAEAMLVRLPLLQPFVTGFGVTDSRHTVLVHLIDEAGNEGWGEGPALDHPFYLPETTGTTYSVVTEYALPLALRCGSLAPRGIATALIPIRGNGFARAAVEAAYWSLEAAATGRSLRDLIGGTQPVVPVGDSIGITETVEQTVEVATERVAAGYQRIKLKIQPGWDAQVVAAVREELGGELMLQVDANAAYTLDDAPALAKLDRFDLACIEQPLEWDALGEHAELQRRIRTPICLDESLRSPADVRRALDLDACRNVNCKPARVGGISATLEIAALCEQRGVPLWCGGMMESGIGRAGNLALAALPAFNHPADMSPAAELFAWDLVDPTYELEPDGTIRVPTASGLGFPVRRDRIAEQLVRHDVLLGPEAQFSE